jgi:hypothetical protein
MSLTNYNGLQVPSTTPTGDGGAAIAQNFKNLILWNPKSFLNASTSPPSSSYNESSYYYPGSLYLDTTHSQLFICLSSGMSTSTWQQIPLQSGTLTNGHLAGFNSSGQIIDSGIVAASVLTGLSAGSGISVSGSTITNTGVISTSAGTGITVSGTNPLNISTNLAAGTGITITGTAAQTISTNLAAGTAIGLSGSGTNPVTITNDGVTSIVAGSNITVSGATGAVTINAPNLAGSGLTFVTVDSEGESLPNSRAITAGTGISLTDGGSGGEITIANAGVTHVYAGTGIHTNQSTGSVDISNTGVISITAGSGTYVTNGGTGATTISLPSPNYYSGNPSNPTGTSTNGTLLMMGLGSTIKITTANTGIIEITIIGYLYSYSSQQPMEWQLYWGTGSSPPANNTAVSGNSVAPLFTGSQYVSSTSANAIPVCMHAIINTGASVGTVIWADVALYCNFNPGYIVNIQATMKELPN